MNCNRCEQPNEAGSLFCQYCGSRMEFPPEPSQTQPIRPASPPPYAPAYAAETGAERPAHAKRAKGSVVTIILSALCVLLAVVIVLMALGVTDAVFAAGKTFKAPEDAIEYFISRVKASDYEGAMVACAVEEVAGNYDYEALVKRMQAMSPSMPYLPSQYEMYAAYNETSLKNQIMRQIAYMAMSAALPEEYDGFLYDFMTLYGDQIDYGDLIKDMNPEDFIRIEIVEIGQVDCADDDAFLDNMEEQAEIYGADQMAAYDVLYDIGGDYYAGGVTLLRYGKRWLILSLTDTLIAQPYNGALIPLRSKADFDDLLGGEYTGSGTSAQPSESPTAEASEAPQVSAASVEMTFTVGLSLPYMTSDWYSIMQADITTALVAYGYEVYASDANYDTAIQVSQVQDFIARGVDAIVIDPMDPGSCSAALMQASEAGIAVILLRNDAGIVQLNGLYASAIGYDYYNEAYILAKWMEKNLAGDIRIGEITGMAGIQYTMDCSEGFNAVVKQNPGWEVVASVAADFSMEGAMVAAEEMLVTYPGLDVLFCHTDYMATGAAEAVTAAGLQGEVLVVGIGNMLQTLEAIQSGRIAAVSTTDPHVGGMVADIVDKVLTGRTVEQRIYVPSQIIDQTNISSMWHLGF